MRAEGGGGSQGNTRAVPGFPGFPVSPQTNIPTSGRARILDYKEQKKILLLYLRACSPLDCLLNIRMLRAAETDVRTGSL